MAADLQSALVDRWSTPQFFLFSCGNNWSRTNFYGFSVRRIDHLCYVSMFFFVASQGLEPRQQWLRTTRTTDYAIRQLLRRVTDSNRMRFHARLV